MRAGFRKECLAQMVEVKETWSVLKVFDGEIESCSIL